MSLYKYNKVVIKIGSNVLTDQNGDLDQKIMNQITNQVAILKESGMDIVLISSGAVASGRALVKFSKKTDSISARQVLASVGQVKLLNHYYELFNEKKLVCSQVLVTKEDFRDRSHYLNMKNCFNALIQNNIIPIVNENDVISITELMFTDNDELAGLIATMINTEALIILSNVDGIYNGDPKKPDTKVIQKVDDSIDFSKFISQSKSDFGRGGMITKSTIARKVSKNGITVKIANGKTKNILLDLLSDNNHVIGTTFLPVRTISNTKKRIAFSETFAKGEVKINEGAKNALTSEKATSLLMVGIINISGEFQKGDVIRILDHSDKVIGMGKVEYGAKKAIDLMGKQNQKPLVHYDYLYLIE